VIARTGLRCAIAGGGAGGSEVNDQRLDARPGIWPWRLQPDLSELVDQRLERPSAVGYRCVIVQRSY
jgi:hypothetical protein